MLTLPPQPLGSSGDQLPQINGLEGGGGVIPFYSDDYSK